MAGVLAKTGAPPGYKSESTEFLTNHLHCKFGGPWQFNSVVGWLRLYADGHNIFGELWELRKDAASKRPRMLCVSGSDTLALSLQHEKTSQSIRRHLVGELQRFARECKKGQYVALAEFERLAPFVNWKQLLATAN